MSNENGTKIEEQVNSTEEPKATILVEQEGKGKKIVKWLIRGAVVVATGIVSFFIGRASVKDDEEETENTDDQTA